MGKLGCALAGLLGVVLGLWGLARWWPLALTWLKAAVPLMLLAGGVVALVAALAEPRGFDGPPPPAEGPRRAV